MATFVKFNDFTNQLGRGTHAFNAHVVKAVFTNTAPNGVTNAVLTDIAQIPAGGGYTSGGFTVNTTWTASGGVAKLTIANTTFTAAGSVGPFRYVVLYNSTPTSPAAPLIGYYDYGTSVTLGSNETFSLAFDQTNGVFDIT